MGGWGREGVGRCRDVYCVSRFIYGVREIMVIASFPVLKVLEEFSKKSSIIFEEVFRILKRVLRLLILSNYFYYYYYYYYYRTRK